MKSSVAMRVLQQLCAVHMAGEEFDGGLYMLDVINVYTACLRWTRVEMQRLLHYLVVGYCIFVCVYVSRVLQPTVTTSSLHDTVGALTTELDEVEQYCVRIKSRIPRSHEQLLSERETSAYKNAQSSPIQHTLKCVFMQISVYSNLFV